jgi:hypothetical protein
MARKSNTSSAREKTTPEYVPNPLRSVGAVLRATPSGTKRKVPMIVLCGDWLKAAGFPVGAPIYVTSQSEEEMQIYRMCTARKRALRISVRKRGR